jgi:hypothetical protein
MYMTLFKKAAYFLWSFLQQNPCPGKDAKLAKAPQDRIE